MSRNLFQDITKKNFLKYNYHLMIRNTKLKILHRNGFPPTCCCGVVHNLKICVYKNNNKLFIFNNRDKYKIRP